MRRFFQFLVGFLFVSAISMQPVFCKDTLKTSPQIQKYILKTPNKTKTDNTVYPLVVFLDGAGSLSNYTVLTSDTANVLSQQSKYNFILFAPMFTDIKDWDKTFSSLKDMLDQIIAEYPVDKDRIYLTGLSMGGYAGWRFAIQNPDLFAAFAPLAGGPPSPNLWDDTTLSEVGILKDIPVKAYHSIDDKVVPMARAQEIIGALEKAGGKPELVELKGSEHTIFWVYTKAETGLWQWMFSQSRNAKKE